MAMMLLLVMALTLPATTMGRVLNPDPNPPPNGAEELIDGGDDEVLGECLGQNSTKRSTGAPNKWPSGRVPYVIDGSLGSRAREAIREAIQDLERYTCIRMPQRTSESDFVRFIWSSKGCWSPVGKAHYMPRNGQEIGLGTGCEKKGIVIHEIMHALGFYHEQARPDRDSFVDVFDRNVRPDMAHNFDKKQPNAVLNLNHPYDIESIMHYDRTAFTVNGRNTLESSDPRKSPTENAKLTDEMGQRRGLTDLDVLEIKKAYCGESSSSAPSPAPVPQAECVDSDAPFILDTFGCKDMVNHGAHCQDDTHADNHYIQLTIQHCPKLCGRCQTNNN